MIFIVPFILGPNYHCWADFQCVVAQLPLLGYSGPWRMMPISIHAKLLGDIYVKCLPNGKMIHVIGSYKIVWFKKYYAMIIKSLNHFIPNYIHSLKFVTIKCDFLLKNWTIASFDEFFFFYWNRILLRKKYMINS